MHMLLPAHLILLLGSAPTQDATKGAALAIGNDYVRSSRALQGKARAEVDVDAAGTELDARDARITNELASTGAPDWAGTYYQGDGLGTNVTLRLAPKSGATYTWSGCVGVYDVNHGSIASVSPEGIEIELAFPPERNEVWYQAFAPHPYMSRRWVPVSWGKERFMIPDCQLITFCNAVNDGSGWLPFPHRVEGEDWHRKVERSKTLPLVPPAYRPFLLETPLTAVITACSEPKDNGTFLDETTPQDLVCATVELGSDAGLLPGMLLHAQAPGRGTGEVVEVTAKQATVEFRYAMDVDQDIPRPSWSLSTLRSAKRK
jgi:hypothetical protein